MDRCISLIMADGEINSKDAQQQARSMFQIVRKKVRRLMVRAGEQQRPGPMDWIYESRTYGMKIRFNTVGDGKSWWGMEVSFQRIRFRMEQLSDMLYGLVDEMRADVGFLMKWRDATRMSSDNSVRAGGI